MPPLAESKLWRADRPGRYLALISLVLTVACGRATSTEPEPKSAPAAAEAPEPTSLEQAEAELEQARAELEQASLSHQDARASVSESAAAPAPPAGAPAAPAATMPAPKAEKEASRPEPAREARKKAGADIEDTDRDASPSGAAATPLSSCERSCKAFGSLKRARDAICRLDEQGGARCSRADGVVRDAEGKVQSCGCPR
jgi:hypothetical protein